MKTTYPIALVLAMAIAGLMLAGSGFSAGVGVDRSSDQLSGEVGRVADNSSIDDGFDGDVRAGSDDSIVGFIISGTGEVFRLFKLAILLPSTIRGLGFPGWFANPMGRAIQIIVSVGLVQFAVGRILR